MSEPIDPDSRAGRFLALDEDRKRACAIIACRLALPAWEARIAAGGETFCIPDAFVVHTLSSSFGRDAIAAAERGRPVDEALVRMCEDVDWAASMMELRFDRPELEWAAFSFANLVRATAGTLTHVRDVPGDDPFLLVANQAVTAAAFHRRDAPLGASWSTTSIDGALLNAVIDEWWAASTDVLRGRVVG